MKLKVYVIHFFGSCENNKLNTLRISCKYLLWPLYNFNN